MHTCAKLVASSVMMQPRHSAEPRAKCDCRSVKDCRWRLFSTQTKRKRWSLRTNKPFPSVLSLSLPLPSIHSLAAVRHLDWRLRGGLWRADESKEPISASEATAAVLCSPAHLPPPPCALLPASHCLLRALLPPLPAANEEWTSSRGGKCIVYRGTGCSLSVWLALSLRHQGETGTRKLVAGETTAFRSAAPDICSAVRNFMKHSRTERPHTAAAAHSVLYFTSPLVSSSF